MTMVDLYLALDESVLFNVSSETTARGLWDKLRSMYEGMSMSNTNRIMGQVKKYA